jgi:hypothetical protein
LRILSNNVGSQLANISLFQYRFLLAAKDFKASAVPLIPACSGLQATRAVHWIGVSLGIKPHDELDDGCGIASGYCKQKMQR